ncbi:hypothetical protein [Phaffia rhodozyma]|uniref:Transmembrane protein n=1 Tax=Phaffia rhodozyma TaxID=264483 RepID=A0A0F7SFS8_PHARH|nr:hypothetical protein [Phaffia rhodozyma]
MKPAKPATTPYRLWVNRPAAPIAFPFFARFHFFLFPSPRFLASASAGIFVVIYSSYSRSFQCIRRSHSRIHPPSDHLLFVVVKERYPEKGRTRRYDRDQPSITHLSTKSLAVIPYPSFSLSFFFFSFLFLILFFFFPVFFCLLPLGF